MMRSHAVTMSLSPSRVGLVVTAGAGMIAGAWLKAGAVYPLKATAVSQC